MRVLLIDNHDSFSAILFHYLWELAGEKPWFVSNDAITEADLLKLEFDAAVFSPGPGHPAQSRDFGICRAVLELFPARPILGVCLGHQGLAHFAGARILPWPGARHGRPSRILHDGRGLFQGLPPGFEAIRYHSLTVAEDGLPRNIEVTARSEDDGQIMGLRFRDRPWFGVQFHPESVGTAHGKALLRNFLGAPLARPVPPQGDPPVPHAMSASVSADLRWRELPWRDPEAVFVRHFAGERAAFWLDGEQARPAAGWPVTAMGKADVVCRLRRDGLEIRRWDATSARWRSASVAGPPLELFAARRQACHADAAAPWCGYRGGPVGHFGYELHHLTMPVGTAPAGSDDGEPLGRWLEPEGFVIFDHHGGRVYAAWGNSPHPPEWLQTVCDGWPNPAAEKVAEATNGADALPPLLLWWADLPQAGYCACVRRLQHSIASGDTYEACLTQAFKVESAADALSIFRRLRRGNPAPYAAYLVFDDLRLLSSSPELFLEATPEGGLRSRPIKGTRPRGATPERDAALREELRHHPKERAENRMIVDLTRHDFSRVCALGSVQVTALFEVETHPGVHQLVSEIRGRLDPALDPCGAVWSCFPGGSMTGAPKERTVELLAAIEAEPRGAYAGALGYFSGGAFCLAMTIRTLEQRGRDWRLGCGGAVLADSDPEAEWKEALLKARSVIDVVGARRVTVPVGPGY